MKTFIEYGWGDPPDVQEACGDRSIVQIDGRLRMRGWIEEGHVCNGWRRPVYGAFRILRGESLLRSRPVTDWIKAKG